MRPAMDAFVGKTRADKIHAASPLATGAATPPSGRDVFFCRHAQKKSVSKSGFSKVFPNFANELLMASTHAPPYLGGMVSMPFA